MKSVIPGARALEVPLTASAVTIGVFDGVHLGHQALVRRAVERGRALGATPIAYTFDPHPAQVLAPHYAPRMLTAIRERVRLLRALGIEQVVVEPFDRAFAALDADDWVERYLVDRLRARSVVVGFNFSYGGGRAGGPEALARAGARLGFEVEIVPQVVVSTLGVSSTRVREFVLEGNVEGARLLLGRDFALTGTVVRGQERGRQLGIPTANLEPEGEILPANGVYATRVVIDPSDEPSAGAAGAPRAPELEHLAVTNIGVRPTFQGRSVTVESHLLDFSGELYGRRIRVALVGRLRDERKFAGVEALVAEVRADIAAARQILGTARAD